MLRRKLIWQLFPSYLVITLLALLAITWFMARSWRQFYFDHTISGLTAAVRLGESQVRELLNPPQRPQILKWCKDSAQRTGARVTVILPAGEVLGDSEEDPARMDNHSDRPEFKQAFQGQVGVSSRYSYTLKRHMVYVAMAVKDQDKLLGALRLALPVTALDQALGTLWVKSLAGALVIVLVVAALSFYIARRFSQPLEDLKRGALRFSQGDLSRRLPVPESDELGGLAKALNLMADQLEERLNTLTRQTQLQEAVFASMVEGVLAVDREERLIILNQAAARLLEVSPEEVQNRKVAEVVKDSELQWFITRTLSTPGHIDGEISLAQGRRLVQGHGTLLRDSQGTVMGVLIVLHDITHLRRLEKTKQDFVANVSHELKTPVTAIKGFVETLLAGALKEPENAERFLRIIAHQTDRLQEIIEDLLTLSSLEQDVERGMIFLTTERIKPVLAAAVEICEPKAATKNIVLQLECADDLRANLNAPLLEQALVNLIDNAIKYSEPGGIVQISARRSGSEVTVAVQDQGCGIPRTHLPRIFERFYRVDPGRSRKLGGTGLGLAIVKHIAQAHRGRVTVTSTPGQGSTFTLHLRAE